MVNRGEEKASTILPSNHLMHLDVVGFKKKRAEEKEKGIQKATEKNL